uniref:Uncharacterized protein n=1 Tax=Siphoviridae sp. ct16M3 TaxID=2825305 RepID=A0A8S5PPB5_9CAUD|nr:MAG TPA: hypothetical protein [Siphoviridae sp. ct16M3]
MKKINIGCLVSIIGSIIVWLVFFYVSYKVWCWLWT